MFLDKFATRALALPAGSSRALALPSRNGTVLRSSVAPSGALSSMQWNAPNQPMYPDFSGEAAIENVYLKNTYAYRCVDVIANSIAGLPFRSGKEINGKSYDMGAPLARLLGPAPGSPNPSWSAFNLWRYSIAQYVLLGKFAWVYERDNLNRIVGVWPLMAQHLYPVPATSGSDYFSRFEYGYKGQAGYTEFKTSDVAYIYRHSLLNPRQPESAIQPAAVNVNIHQLIDTFDYNFLKNGGVPNHIVQVPPFASGDEREAFRQQFLSEFGGPANAGKVFISEVEVEEGDTAGAAPTMNIKQIGLSQRDAQLAVLRDAKIRDITAAFGVPLSILGDSTLAKFQNAPEDRKVYWRETLKPKILELQDGINTQLSPLLGGPPGWFDLADIPELRQEPVFDDRWAPALVQAGLVERDEFRADRGLPPAAEVGLPPYVVPSTAEPNHTATLDNNPAPTAPAVTVDQTKPPASAPALKASVRRSDSTRRPQLRHAGGDHQSVPSGHLTKNVLETLLSSQLRTLFAEQETAIQERLRGRRARRMDNWTAESLYDASYWESRTTTVIAPVLVAAGVSEARTTAVVVRVVDSLLTEIRKTTEEASSPDGLSLLIADVFLESTNRALSIIERGLHPDAVSISEVERVLLDMHSGQITAEEAVSLWAN